MTKDEMLREMESLAETIRQQGLRIIELEKWRGRDVQQDIIDEQANVIIAQAERIEFLGKNLREKEEKFGAAEAATIAYHMNQYILPLRIDEGARDLKIGEMIWRGEKKNIAEHIVSLERDNDSLRKWLEVLRSIFSSEEINHDRRKR